VWRSDEQQHLSVRGRVDAERVADRLRAFPIAAVYASPYPRAAETVAPLADRLGLTVRIEPDLRERRLSPGRVPDFEAAVQWAWEHPDGALPGGEPNRRARERVLALLDRLRARHPGQHVALCTHGSLMTLLFHYADPSFTLDDWAQMTMPDIYRIGTDGHIERLWEQ
jgi:2,3-bisphosphoglycerate-dependent phosphoglycerate mutase